jgi:hypothetical protein
MISNIKGYPVLKGVRGQKPVNFSALEKCLLNISKMMWKLNQGKGNKSKGTRIKELDINPLFVDNKRCVAADIRVFV